MERGADDGAHHHEPVGVERLGVVLEPQAPYELNAHTGGGVEDPRVTYIAEHGLYVMTYTAFGEAGPRLPGRLGDTVAGTVHLIASR